MRVFEAMAAGDSADHSLPTELSELGFVDGEHFIGYQTKRISFQRCAATSLMNRAQTHTSPRALACWYVRTYL